MIESKKPVSAGPLAELVDHADVIRARASAAAHQAHLLHIGHVVFQYWPAASALHVRLEAEPRRAVLSRVVDEHEAELWSSTGQRDDLLGEAVRQIETELRAALGGDDPRMHWHELDAASTLRVTLPDPDHVRSVLESEPARPGWIPPSEGRMYAVLLDFDHAHIVEISARQPGQDVMRLVGDPFVDRMGFVPDLDFWVPDSGAFTSRPNLGAARFLLELLQDVVFGEFAVDDAARERIKNLLDAGGWDPVIYGRCLITGVNEAGDDPGPLSETFQQWLTRYILDEPRSEVEGG